MPINNFTQIFQTAGILCVINPNLPLCSLCYFISSLATSLLIPNGALPTNLTVSEQTGTNELQALLTQTDTTHKQRHVNGNHYVSFRARL